MQRRTSFEIILLNVFVCGQIYVISVITLKKIEIHSLIKTKYVNLSVRNLPNHGRY